MSDGTKDDLKGRVKEAAGDLTDDQDLKNEGKVDKATGAVKDAVGESVRESFETFLKTYVGHCTS